MNNIIQSAMSNHIDFKKEIPSKDSLLHELEPFLKKPMTLYGGFVKLKMEVFVSPCETFHLLRGHP